jgi:hypothetical protein
MTQSQCYDTGTLRLYMESPSAMPDAERAAIAAHLATCADCRAEVDSLRALEAKVMSQLSMLAPTQAPDMQTALMKMRAKLRQPEAPQSTATQPVGGESSGAGSKSPFHDKGSDRIQAISPIRQSRRRALFSGLATAVVLLSFISFPTLRAAADSLLQTFRVKSVVFVPVDSVRMKQLGNLLSDPTSLFITQPTIVGTPKATKVSSAKDAAQLAGFTPEQPSTLPAAPASTRFTVHDSMRVQAQVNIATIRKLLTTAGINNIALPDALGSAPITADVPAFVESTYSGEGYTVTLVQGRSPNVTLPAGVNLAQLGKAGLELIGMQPDQADQMSRQIDWSSTLVVPFPANLSDVLKVDVGGAPGLLVSSGGASNNVDASRHNLVLYWQNGDQFYVLAGQGPKMTNDILLLTARSVR